MRNWRDAPVDVTTEEPEPLEILLNRLKNLSMHDGQCTTVEWKHIEAYWSYLQESRAIDATTHRHELPIVHQILWLATKETSPLELHTIAMQSTVSFFELDNDDNDASQTDNPFHEALCYLIAAHALQRCPTPLSSRKKRWRSATFETIRQFQNSKYKRMDIWSRILLPSCLHVVNMAPFDDAERNAWVATAVATFTDILAEEGEQISQNDLMDTYQRLTVLVGDKQDVVLRYPLYHWETTRRHNASTSSSVTNNREDNLLKWTLRLNENQSAMVAHANTSWDRLGLAMIAFITWKNCTERFTQNSEIVLSPRKHKLIENWHLWFPHVDPLLQSDSVIVQSWAFELLSDLTFYADMRHSISSSLDWSPICPLGTLQLLSNHLLQISGRSPLLPNQAQLFSLMRSTLQVYRPSYQVDIVKHLIDECPIPALKPRLVDLIRHLALKHDNSNVSPHGDMDHVWDFIVAQINRMIAITSLEDCVAELINDSEFYVAILSLVHLFMLQNPQANPEAMKDLITNLWDASRAINKYKDFGEESFRLLLLSDATERAIELLSHQSKIEG